MPEHSYLYSIPYLFVAFFLFLLYKQEKKRKSLGLSSKVPRNIAFIVMLIFIGLRGHLHTDFINYYPYFEWLPTLFDLDGQSFTNFEYLYEPGFIIYTSLCKTLVDNYFVWVFINTLIDLIVFRHIFKRYSTSEILPFFFLLVFYGLTLEFNNYRNVKALDLFLLSIPFLLQKRFMPYLLLNLLGMSFHVSSIFYIFLYPFLNRKLPIALIGLIIAAVNVLYLCNIHLTSNLIDFLAGIFGDGITSMDKLSNYGDSGDAYKFSFGYFERTFSVVLCTLLYPRLIRKNSENIWICNCMILYYVTHLFFSDVQVFAERIPLLFVFAYWLIYTNIFGLNFKYRPLVVVFILLLSVLKITLGCATVTNYYDNVIWGIMDYNEREIYVNSTVNN